MIRSFASKETEQFFRTGHSRRIPPEIQARAMRRLQQLDAAACVGDMKFPPSNRLELLSGTRDRTYSIRINEQWRICFRFEGVHANDVEVVDYH
ncbi:type II toxin-antitoxin system RelE/ParE family toxin [Usitatibacter palustris]|uniref:type II toxin-antitoxin system RelE/ParE family toxin n=1 Tax=Usitatibacter palustris TaxID=2732487 RepID=UPI001488D61E|nr:type II toxin-antitoxin system RelE/ParE family toxin [Usitatibacter palustris]